GARKMRANGEVARRRTSLSDLCAVSTLPVAWVWRQPRDIASALADVLIGSLRLDFAFVRLCDPTRSAVVEVTRGDGWKGFPDWLQRHLAVVRWSQSGNPFHPTPRVTSTTALRVGSHKTSQKH